VIVNSLQGFQVAPSTVAVTNLDELSEAMLALQIRRSFGGAVAQLGARLDGIEEVVGSNPIGSTNFVSSFQSDSKNFKGH
jgi:hypothetical protein